MLLPDRGESLREPGHAPDSGLARETDRALATGEALSAALFAPIAIGLALLVSGASLVVPVMSLATLRIVSDSTWTKLVWLTDAEIGSGFEAATASPGSIRRWNNESRREWCWRMKSAGRSQPTNSCPSSSR